MSVRSWKPRGITPMTVWLSRSSDTVRPMTLGSEPKRRCQRPWLKTTTRSPSGWSSSARKVRPKAGGIPRIGKKLADTRLPRIRSGSCVPVRLTVAPAIAAMSSKTWFCCLQSKKFAGATAKRVPPGGLSQTNTTRSGSSYGRGRSITPFTRLKIAVGTPMPIASVSTTTTVKPGCLRSDRSETRKSWIRLPMDHAHAGRLVVSWSYRRAGEPWPGHRCRSPAQWCNDRPAS